MQNCFSAAMSMADITPKKEEYLQGYEEECELSRCTLERHTTDLKARVFLISNGDNTLCFLNFEMIFSDPCFDEPTLSLAAQDRIAAICHTERKNLIFSNTHDHQSYMTLAESEEENLIEAVRQAYERLRPVHIGLGSVCTKFGCSRGGRYRLDESVPYDSLMNVLRLDDAQTKKPIGMIYSVPMHNTVFGNGPGLKAVHNQLCCEFTGCASRALENSFEDPCFVAMHINGFYGNTTGCVGQRFYSENIDDLRNMGAQFANELRGVFESIETVPLVGEIKSEFIDSTLSVRNHSDMSKEQWGDVDELPCRLTLASFADIAFIGVNSEPFSIIGARLKAEAPFRLVIPAGNVGGWKGYIPTAVTFDSTEYQAECVAYKSPYGKSTEEVFYQKLISALCGLAGVKLRRTEPAFASQEGNTFTYDFDAPVCADKLVISFGELSRNDCAVNFTVLLYFKQNLVKTDTITENSVNFRSVDTENVRFDRAVITIGDRWQGSESSFVPQLWAVRFDEVQQ